jgi:hypothetical protein
VNGKVLPTRKDSRLVGERFNATVVSGTIIGSPISPVPYGRVAIIRISLGWISGQFRNWMRMSGSCSLGEADFQAKFPYHAEISTFHCCGGGLFRVSTKCLFFGSPACWPDACKPVC